MGLRMKIEGSESIYLPETSITKVVFGADIPQDSNARSTDLGSTVLVSGRILTPVDGEAADDTASLPGGLWCLRRTWTATGTCR